MLCTNQSIGNCKSNIEQKTGSVNEDNHLNINLKFFVIAQGIIENCWKIVTPIHLAWGNSKEFCKWRKPSSWSFV